MEVLVDNKSVDDAFIADGITLEDALRHLQEKVCAAGSMVTALRCDGREVPASAMAETLGKPAASFQRLEISTGTREALVLDALKEASSCLTQTQEACREVAVLLTEGRTDDAVKDLRECLSVWQKIHDAIGKSIEILELDAEQMTVGERTLLELISRPKGVLLQVKDALIAQDYVMLADILKYEFDEVTDCWHQIIARVKREAEERHPQPGSA